MTMKLYMLVLTCLFCVGTVLGQPYLDSKRDYSWPGGYGWSPPNYTENFVIVFNQDTIQAINYRVSEIPLASACAVLADVDGSLLFASNGQRVADSLGQLLPGGHDIHPLNFDDDTVRSDIVELVGLNANDLLLMLPDPGQANLFHIFHEGMQYQVTQNGTAFLNVYHTIIDRNLNAGLGDVVQMSIPILTDTMTGAINAFRHANGRDWWIVAPPSAWVSGFHLFLLTPAGVQYIGLVDAPRDRIHTAMQSLSISPDGHFLARHFLDFTALPNWVGYIEVYGLDRCQGTFSFMGGVQTPDLLFENGVEFSPNSRMLYKVGPNQIWQYDLYQPNWQTTGTLVAEFDNHIDTLTMLPSYTSFGETQLAPDDRVYISTVFGTHYMHVINRPDEKGIACDFRMRKIQLPLMTAGLPNMPTTFRLGAQVGSACDSLGIGNPAGLVTWPDTLDFGNISPGQDSTLYLYAYNPGYTRTYLSYLHGHEPPFSTLKDHYRINPGDTLAIPVSFSSSVSGIFDDTMQVRNNVQDFNVALRANVTGTVGLDKPNMANGIELYPNPATDAFMIHGIELLDDAVLEIHDLQGRRVLLQALPANINSWTVSLQGFPTGMYLLQCHDSKGIQYQDKLVINRP